MDASSPLSRPGRPLFVLRTHTREVLSCSFHPQTIDSSRTDWMISGDAEGVVQLWDLAIRAPILSFEPINTAVEAVPGGLETRGSGPAGVVGVGFLTFPTAEDSLTHSRSREASESVRPPTSSSALRALCGDGALTTTRARYRGPRRPTTSNNKSRSPSQVVYFYTQCRNHRVYIWSWMPPAGETTESSPPATPRLLHRLAAPQHGFCPVAMIAPSETAGRTLMVVPHDADGMVGLWYLQLDPAVGPTTPSSESRVLQVGCLGVFSTSPGFKGGTIMHLAFRDDSHLSVSFESGHLSLCQVTLPSPVTTMDTTAAPTMKANISVVGSVRAFSESALACAWKQEVVVCTSVEGHLSCYHYTQEESEQGVTQLRFQLAWEHQTRRGVGSVGMFAGPLVVIGGWDGYVRLHHLVDGRLITILAQHDGPIHQVVLAQAASTLNRFGFDPRMPRVYNGCDVAERACVARNDQPLSSNCGDMVCWTPAEKVLLFASIGQDGTIAVWRIDFHVLSELAAQLAPSVSK